MTLVACSMALRASHVSHARRCLSFISTLRTPYSSTVLQSLLNEARVAVNCNLRRHHLVCWVDEKVSTCADRESPQFESIRAYGAGLAACLAMIAIGMCPAARMRAAAAIQGLLSQAAVLRNTTTGRIAIGTGIRHVGSYKRVRWRPARRYRAWTH